MQKEYGVFAMDSFVCDNFNNFHNYVKNSKICNKMQ